MTNTQPQQSIWDDPPAPMVPGSSAELQITPMPPAPVRITKEIAATMSIDQLTAVDMAVANRIAGNITTRMRDMVQQRIHVSPQHNHRASSFGEACDRRLYHDIVDWESKLPFSESTIRAMMRGQAHEPAILDILTQCGYRVIGEQSQWFDRNLRISGRIEGHICESESGRNILVEIKSTASRQLTACKSLDQLRANRWGNRYYTQVQIYLYLFGLNAAVLVIMDVSTWELSVIPMPLDWEFADRMAKRAERINDHIDRRVPPDHIQNTAECKRCPHFGRACNPPMSYGEGTAIITDEELLAMFHEADELEMAGDRYADVVKEIKERVKGLGETVLAGDYIVTNKVVKSTTYDIPKEIKAQYAKPGQQVRTSWEKLNPTGGDQ